MSFELALVVTLVRAVFVTIFGACLLPPLRRVWAAWPAAALAVLLLPALFPGLVVGYAFANSALSLIHRPWLNELLYSFLLAIRTIPLGLAAYLLTPAGPITPEAVHCWRLARNATHSQQQRILGSGLLLLKGPPRRLLMGALAIFLFSVQDFELASMLGTVAWPVWLFDAQSTGLEMKHALSYALLACLPQLVILGLAATTVVTSQRIPVAKEIVSSRGRTDRFFAFGFLLCALLLGCLFPTAFVFRGTLRGLTAMRTNPSLLKEIGVALGGGLIAGSVAYGLATVLLCNGIRKRWLALVLAGSIPGLLGPLILSLLLVSCFQLPAFATLYQSVIPWLLGLTLYLLPRGLLLRFAVARWTANESITAIRLLHSGGPSQRRSAARLRWTLVWSPHVWSGLLLIYWAYFDVTVAAILCPSGLTSVQVRLYNLMHYGQSAVLSTMVCATLLAPLLVLWMMHHILRRFA